MKTKWRNNDELKKEERMGKRTRNERENDIEYWKGKENDR